VDQFDLAQEMAARYRNQHLDAQLRKIRARAGQLGTTNCISCSKPIPLKRRDADPGCVRCISCQEEHEKGGG